MAEEMLRVAEKVVGREAKRVLLSYIQHKMAECLEEIRMFESKYGMDFEEFCEKFGREIPHDWEHERDLYEWEAAITELRALVKEYERMRE